MDLFLLFLASTFSAMVRMFVGFGLGTILLPVYALFVPPAIAVAMTAVVHLVSASAGGCLFWKHVDKVLALRFGIPSVLGSLLGAMVLVEVAEKSPKYSLGILGLPGQVDAVKGLVGALIVAFAIVDLGRGRGIQRFMSRSAVVAGLLTGFFGGLSGHQGALRAGFLSAMRLEPKVFVGTQSLIAVMIDVSRLLIYGAGLSLVMSRGQAGILLTGVGGGIFGSLVAQKFIVRKASSALLHALVALALILFGSAMILGLI